MNNDYLVADVFEVGNAQDVIQSGAKHTNIDESGQLFQVNSIDDDE